MITLISGYTDAAERRAWNNRCEAEAREKYDEARKQITDIAAELSPIEHMITDGIAEMDDATSTMAFVTDKMKKLSELYVEVHKWKIVLKNLGLDP